MLVFLRKSPTEQVELQVLFSRKSRYPDEENPQEVQFLGSPKHVRQFELQSRHVNEVELAYWPLGQV